MMDRIAEAYWTAETQKQGLYAVAQILQTRNPRLNLISAVCLADAIAYCLHNSHNTAALRHLDEALNYTGE